MDRQDRIAIEAFCDRLERTARSAPPRDGEAEALLQRRLAGIPGASYRMAQTILAQEAALSAAEDRIAELEARLAEQAEGGFLAGLFGDDRGPGRRRPAAITGGEALRPGPGFLGGAAQTAMGVAGGVLLANALTGLLAPLPDGGADDLAGFDDFDI